MKPKSAFRDFHRSRCRQQNNLMFTEINDYLAPFREHMDNFAKVDNVELMKDYIRSTSPRAKLKIRDRLIYHNIKLAVKVALYYSNRGVPTVDLIQEGVLGLMKAIDKFEPERGFLFSTYAVWWIRQVITRAVFDQTDEDPYRIPINFREKISIVKVETYKLVRDANGEWPSAEKILAEIKKRTSKICESFTLEDVLKAQIHMAVYNIHLDEELESFETGETTSVESMVADKTHNYANPENMVEARRQFEESQRFLDLLEEQIYSLGLRIGAILKHRLGINGAKEMTLEELGQIFKITRERIRQIELQGHAILQERLSLSKKDIQDLIIAHEEIAKIVSSIL